MPLEKIDAFLVSIWNSIASFIGPTVLQIEKYVLCGLLAAFEFIIIAVIPTIYIIMLAYLIERGIKQKKQKKHRRLNFLTR